MTAEQIVRALAAADPMHYEDGRWVGCFLCDARLPDEPEQHDTDCPWRLAVEWVAAHEALSRALAATDEAGWLTDESGWQSFTNTEDGYTRFEIVLTRRGKRSMSARQLDDLRRGMELAAHAFTPDEPIRYADEAAANLEAGVPSWVDEAEAALARAAASGQDVEAARRDLDAIEAAANLKHGTEGGEG